MKRKRVLEIVILILMVIVAALFLTPIYYLVINAFKPLKEVILNTGAFPKTLYFENFKEVWQKSNYIILLKNSIIVTFFSLLGIVVLGSMAGYKLSRMKSKFSNGLILYFILTLIIPFQATMIPLVKLLRDLNLMDRIFGLILVYIGMGTPLAIFMYTAGAKSIPISIDESAKIDGAGSLMAFFKIIFPLLSPITSTVIILDGLWIWNDFLLPLITLTSDKNKTIPVGTMNLIMGQYSFMPNYGAAVAILGFLPMLILYIFLQKYIVKGIIEGATKG